MGIYELQHREFNTKLAEQLKKFPEFETPEWALYVKSSTSKERPPYEDDFWLKRAASILRQVYIRRIIGVNRLKIRYGSKKDRGARPPEFRTGGGKIIRTILQQAEKAGLIEKIKDKKTGRILTEKGKKLLEGIK
jgi:small subunit ribosomal protein S19e